MYEVRGTMHQTNHAYQQSNKQTQPQKHNGTNAQRYKRTRYDVPHRPAKPPSQRAAQTGPAPASQARPRTTPGPCRQAGRPVHSALCPSPCSALPGRCPGPCGAVCGCALCFCAVRAQTGAQTGTQTQTLRRRRRWASPRGAVPLACSPACCPLSPGPVVLSSAPYSLAWPGLALCLARSGALPGPVWRSGALALGHGGRIRRGARGAGALRPGCWCRCPT